MFKMFSDLFALLRSIIASATNCAKVGEVHSDIWYKRTVVDNSPTLIEFEHKIKEIDQAQGK